MTLLPSALRPGRLLGPAPAGGGDRASVQGFRLGSPGAPASFPTLLICLFDNSGSVISPTGTDPLSNRFAEVEHAFRAVARRAAPHELGAVLHFDSPCRGDVAPVAISRRGLVSLRSGLAVPSDGAGSSCLLPSLRQAVRLTEAHPEHASTLVVLSDFLLMDSDPAAALAELAAFPGEVHAVVLGSWMGADAFNERITVTPIERDDPPGAVARALFASLVARRPGSSVADPR
ncbi:hypothetical protein [Nocardiopsis sp. LOL_012]|uniref:hypothetical protein n=1 Tax=Nocardiopsis sp. LOL_012 TaxID=3345409 RepID=UPI003A8937B3